MRFFLLSMASLLIVLQSVAQNDMDALRYSQIGVGGNARFVSMGGAFGALGANLACLSYNPAGIGIYRKGEISLSPGIRFINVTSTYNTSQNNSFTPSLILNGIGMAGTWKDKKNADAKHSVGISVNQLQNFNTNITIQGYGNNKSIINDFLDNAGKSSPANLDPSYSGMAFNSYLIDTINGHYYGLIDPSKNMFQTKSVVTTGKINEVAFGYTYGYKDKLYIGASVGIQIVRYNHLSNYTESDDKDSLRITQDAGGHVTDTYSYPIHHYMNSAGTGLLGGFKSMTYTENYSTTGTGYNFKLGAIYRANEYFRFGINYQTPTVLSLTDTYTYSLSTVWDGGDTYTQSYPQSGGTYKYKIITPMRYGASLGFIYKKLFVIGIDYENLSYAQASISSSDATNFSGVNKVISSKYSRASNLRTGLEVNVNNVMLRLGYSMYGSPFGQTFSGQFVRNTISGGIGLRSKNWTFDFALVKQFYSEDYYMYNPQFADKSTLAFSATTFVATIGARF